jgi:hypothetical protein
MDKIVSCPKNFRKLSNVSCVSTEEKTLINAMLLKEFGEGISEMIDRWNFFPIFENSEYHPLKEWKSSTSKGLCDYYYKNYVTKYVANRLITKSCRWRAIITLCIEIFNMNLPDELKLIILENIFGTLIISCIKQNFTYLSLWNERYRKTKQSSEMLPNEFRMFRNNIAGNIKYYLAEEPVPMDVVIELFNYLAKEGYILMNDSPKFFIIFTSKIDELYNNKPEMFQLLNPDTKQFIYAASGIRCD